MLVAAVVSVGHVRCWLTLEFVCVAAACPNSFWKQTEPYFAYVTSDDVSYLQRQVSSVYAAAGALPPVLFCLGFGLHT